MQLIIEQVSAWLDTFSMVSSIQGNPDAAAREIEAIAEVFIDEQSDIDLIDQTFKLIKKTAVSRAWPTAAQVHAAISELKKNTHVSRFDTDLKKRRARLSPNETALLEGKILPTFRRWLRKYPGLRDLAIGRLEHWGEPLIDDMGQKYETGDK